MHACGHACRDLVSMNFPLLLLLLPFVFLTNISSSLLIEAAEVVFNDHYACSQWLFQQHQNCTFLFSLLRRLPVCLTIAFHHIHVILVECIVLIWVYWAFSACLFFILEVSNWLACLFVNCGWGFLFICLLFFLYLSFLWAFLITLSLKLQVGQRTGWSYFLGLQETYPKYPCLQDFVTNVGAPLLQMQRGGMEAMCRYLKRKQNWQSMHGQITRLSLSFKFWSSLRFS